MIPNQRPAIYARTIHAPHGLPVVGWDDEGTALVPDPDTGYLRAAHTIPGFQGLAGITDNLPDYEITAVLPNTTDHVLKWKGDANTRPSTEPVIGWAVLTSGRVLPLTEQNGEVEIEHPSDAWTYGQELR